ncbi:hypothetical protein P4560_02755 [Heyndrickxia sporothermodurans]|uniref:hypothetical protein n=1 Tax=Heyndrickxia sporothermodurans TaxID=46224 RepID=UPI002E2187FE|nr:hypothetical protein [Heyndrickxia sporothermodurans]
MDPILSTWKSITLLIVSFAVMFVGILYLGAPSTIVLIFAGVSVIILSVVWGVRWKKIRINPRILDSISLNLTLS